MKAGAYRVASEPEQRWDGAGGARWVRSVSRISPGDDRLGLRRVLLDGEHLLASVLARLVDLDAFGRRRAVLVDEPPDPAAVALGEVEGGLAGDEPAVVAVDDAPAPVVPVLEELDADRFQGEHTRPLDQGGELLGRRLGAGLVRVAVGAQRERDALVVQQSPVPAVALVRVDVEGGAVDLDDVGVGRLLLQEVDGGFDGIPAVVGIRAVATIPPSAATSDHCHRSSSVR